MPHFLSGTLFQVGSRLLSDICQRISPVFTKWVAPYLGQKLVATGEDVAEPVRQGSALRDALKKIIGKTYRNQMNELVQKLSGAGHKRRKSEKSSSVCPPEETEGSSLFSYLDNIEQDFYPPGTILFVYSRRTRTFLAAAYFVCPGYIGIS